MAAGNFTHEIKRELLRNGFESACCKTAALSAFLRTTGSVVRRGGLVGFEFLTESEDVAEFFISLLEDIFGAELKVVQAAPDSRNGRDRLCFECLSARSLYILSELGIAERAGEEISLKLDIDPYIVENDCCKRAYIVGAFLGTGSCSLPREDSRAGYHLEIIFSNRFLADGFCDLLAQFEILAKCVDRKGSRVVYLKSRESISDFLHLAGAESALEKLEELAVRRDERNRINRQSNCAQGNIDKSVLAAVRQVRAIETIEETVGLDALDAPLRAVAEARLADKEGSLKELAAATNLSKSCLNHRLRRLVQLAGELSEEEI